MARQTLLMSISNIISSFTIIAIICNIRNISGFVVHQRVSRPLYHNYHLIQHSINKNQNNQRKSKIHSQTKSQDDEKILKKLDFDNIPPSSPLIPLLNSAINATTLRSADTSNMGHDPFRYEWGTWVNEESLAYLMTKVDEVRLNQGIYDSLINEDSKDKIDAVRLKIAGGRDWDCILHILPTHKEWSGRWPTGSWIIVKALTGVIETSALRGPDRNGVFVKKTSKDLRGGSDGSLGGGKSTGGVECIKYIGGPLRRYTGKSGKGTLLEIVVRPPTGEFKQDPIKPLLNPTDAFSIVSLEPPKEEKKSKSNQIKKEEDILSLNNKLTDTLATNVGGLGDQLKSIARRVLASRSNPEATKRLGVSHVRGILLSGPPGCGKTLMARELANLLGAREPQIVNGPEILDKFIGEAEKKVRDLFLPAELEYNELGEDSALHMIILDEMDAIARKRGSMTSDTTGVRDSVVNQLLAKMDGVKEASNVLVVGLTNRPELLDPALLRPGRLEVQLRVELPDLIGRRDILKIHTRQMRSQGALSSAAIAFIEDVESKIGLPARTEYFSGAELAGLVRSAASFALARTIEDPTDEGIVYVPDLEQALKEVRPALGKQDDVLQMRYPLGIVLYSPAIRQIVTDLKRFITPIPSQRPRMQSLLIAGSGTQGGTGVTALGAYAASQASITGSANYVRCITALDVLASEGGGGEEARAAALVDRFSEAKEMSHSLLFLDDIDQICAGSGPFGYSSIMLSTLRALLRSPPVSTKIGSQENDKFEGRSCLVLAATSRPDSIILQEIFDEIISVPQISSTKAVEMLLMECLPSGLISPGFIPAMAYSIIYRLGRVGCKPILRIVERAAISVGRKESFEDEQDYGEAQVEALNEMLGAMNGGGSFFASDTPITTKVKQLEDEIKTTDDLFLDETDLPMIYSTESVEKLISEGISSKLISPEYAATMAYSIIYRLGKVDSKTALRAVERAVALAGPKERYDDEKAHGEAQVEALDEILEAMEFAQNNL